ncbi:MAG: hypothetical protein ACFFDN_01355 [Candidatus Hodarchaeota archaeon]
MRLLNKILKILEAEFSNIFLGIAILKKHHDKKIRFRRKFFKDQKELFKLNDEL